jgi:hypothetical protein
MFGEVQILAEEINFLKFVLAQEIKNCELFRQLCLFAWL